MVVYILCTFALRISNVVITTSKVASLLGPSLRRVAKGCMYTSKLVSENSLIAALIGLWEIRIHVVN